MEENTTVKEPEGDCSQNFLKINVFTCVFSVLIDTLDIRRKK